MPIEILIQILGFICTTVGWLHVLIVYLCWRVSTHPNGSFYWIVAMAIYSSAFLLYGQRGITDSDTLIVLLPNLVVVTALSLVLIGTCRYLQTRVPIRLIVAVFLLFLGLFPVFIYYYNNMSIRTIIMAIIIMTMHLNIAWLLLTYTPKRPLTYSAAGWIFLFLSSLEIMRLIHAISMLWDNHSIGDPLWSMGGIMTAALFVIPLTAGSFILLIHESDLIQRRQIKQRMIRAESLLQQKRSEEESATDMNHSSAT